MKLTELKAEIERMIAATPYSKEEVLSFLNAESELNPDELFAYSVALEYLSKKKGDHKKLMHQFLKKKSELMERYITP